LRLFDTDSNALLFREAFYYQTSFPLVGQKTNVVAVPVVDTSDSKITLSAAELHLIERIKQTRRAGVI